MDCYEKITAINKLPTSLKKDRDRMKHDMKTYKDKENGQIGMTADHTSRPDKVLFFADPLFLFFNCQPTLHTLASHTSHHSNQSLPKSAICQRYFNIRNMKRIILFITFFIASITAHSQNLSLNEIFALCNKSNWDEVNEYMLKKGWEYHESSKGDDTHYNTITWSYNKEYYGDKAQGWFYLYTYEGYPNKISYSFFNKTSYNTIKSGITAAGLKLVDNSIEDNEIVTKYAGLSFIVTVKTAKREKEESYYSDNSITAYSVVVID